MKTMKFSLLAIAFFFGLFILSCQKEEEEDKEVTLTEAAAFATDDANASNSFDEIYAETDGTAAEMDEANNWSGSSQTKSSQIADSSKIVVVTQGSGDTTSAKWPKTITITYIKWKTKSGHVISSGTITMTQTQRMIRAGATRSLSISNLIIDDSIKINGTKSISNKGLVANKPTIEVKLEDGSITNLNTSKTITREFTHTRTWESGSGTPFWIWDDTYSIAGKASGTNRFGNTYTSTITEKLLIAVGCPWIKNGTVEIKANGKQVVTIDWGYPNTPATCDWKFKIAYGDKIYEVK